MANNKEVGSQGEAIIERYLKTNGYKIIAKNWQNKWGEIDIVARKNKTLHFVEVKTLKQNQGESPFLPEDEITAKKRKQLLKMAQIYLSANKLPLDTSHQIDIAAVIIRENQPDQARYLENALEDNY